MKKAILFFSALFVLTVGVMAQSLTLSSVNGPQPNNSDFLVAGDYQATLSAYLSVTNTTGSDLDVLCKKTEISVLGGTINYFCWVQCYSPSVFLSPDPLIIAANTTNSTSFIGDYDAQGKIGLSVVRYTFYPVGNPNDSVCVNVQYLGGYAGIDDYLASQVKLSEAYPNPASNNVNFTYSIPAQINSGATLVLRNLLGSEVKSFAISGKQGKLSLDVTGIQAGVYFYSLIIDNTTLVTRKLVIQ